MLMVMAMSMSMSMSMLISMLMLLAMWMCTWDQGRYRYKFIDKYIYIESGVYGVAGSVNGTCIFC